MIKISIDESSALDILSIYQLKSEVSDTVLKKEQNQKNFTFLQNELLKEFGKELLDKILTSPEYENLYNANLKTFDAVSKAKTDEVLASIVDKCNHERYICKGKIQETFFNSKLTETKTGYEKLKL